MPIQMSTVTGMNSSKSIEGHSSKQSRRSIYNAAVSPRTAPLDAFAKETKGCLLTHDKKI